MALTIRSNNKFNQEIEKLKTKLNIKAASKIIEYVILNFLNLKNEIKTLNREIVKLNKEKQEIRERLSSTHSAISKKIEAEEQLKKADKELTAIIFSPGELRSGRPGLKNDSKISLAELPAMSAAENFDCKTENKLGAKNV